MNSLSSFQFRWRSLLGASVVVFLLWGVLNFGLATFVPLSLHFNPSAAQSGLVLGPEQDAVVLGSALTEASVNDPRLRAYLVSFMDTMCAFMMAYAILDLALAWFALRRGSRWALWALAIGNLAVAPYYIAMGVTYSRFGVPLLETLPGFTGGPIVITLAATALGWFGLRRTAVSAPAA